MLPSHMLKARLFRLKPNFKGLNQSMNKIKNLAQNHCYKVKSVIENSSCKRKICCTATMGLLASGMYDEPSSFEYQFQIPTSHSNAGLDNVDFLLGIGIGSSLAYGVTKEFSNTCLFSLGALGTAIFINGKLKKKEKPHVLYVEKIVFEKEERSNKNYYSDGP